MVPYAVDPVCRGANAVCLFTQQQPQPAIYTNKWPSGCTAYDKGCSDWLPRFWVQSCCWSTAPTFTPTFLLL